MLDRERDQVARADDGDVDEAERVLHVAPDADDRGEVVEHARLGPEEALIVPRGRGCRPAM